jgi:hypothetical protein
MPCSVAEVICTFVAPEQRGHKSSAFTKYTAGNIDRGATAKWEIFSTGSRFYSILSFRVGGGQRSAKLSEMHPKDVRSATEVEVNGY